MRFDSVCLVYWSVTDPLTQSQSLATMFSLSARGYRLGLVTFEEGLLFNDEARKRELRMKLGSRGISWFPLRYHHRPRMLSTLWDICQGLWLCVKLGRQGGVSVFHSRGTVTAASASVAAKFTGARFFYDADGPLSEEYADAGLWSRKSLSYRLTRWAERRFLSAADAVAVLTRARHKELARFTPRSITVLPCAVDTDRFQFDAGARSQLRCELDLHGTVMVYAGKWGGWYASEEMMDFVAAARGVIGGVRLLILTEETPDRFTEAATKRGIDDIQFIHKVPWQSMPAYLSAADVGLSFVRSLPSKRACSPVKNGEYLACGLPIISTSDIGDYSEMIARKNVGLVVKEMSQAEYTLAARALGDLLLDPHLHSRCRKTAAAEVGFSQIVLPRYLQIYQDLLGNLALAGHTEVGDATIGSFNEHALPHRDLQKSSDS